MKRIVAFLGIFLIAVALLPADEEGDRVVKDSRVAVLPLWFDKDVSVGPVVSDAVQSTIQWAIRFIPGYILVEPDAYPEGQSSLTAFAKKNKLDTVIYGRVDVKDGTYSVSLLLYNVGEDRVAAVQQASVSRSMEIFGLADQLSVAILEQFIGRKLDFGSLQFASGGTGPGVYRVFINDILFGDGVEGLPNFLAGRYQIRVEQVNGKDHVLLFNRPVTVEKGKTARVGFNLVEYGYVTIKRKGPWRTVMVDAGSGPGRVVWNEPMPVPVGERRYRFYQYDWRGELYPVGEESLKVAQGETYPLSVNVVPLGRGLTLLAEGPGAWSATIDGQPIPSGGKVEILPLGKHTVEVRQTLQGRELVLFTAVIKVDNRYDHLITFTPLDGVDQPAPLKNGDYVTCRIDRIEGPPAVSMEDKIPLKIMAEVQTAGGSLLSVGGRFVAPGGHVAASVLAGFYTQEETFYLSGQVKLHWLPLVHTMLSPELGGSLYLSTDFDRIEWLAGPEAGIAWNTGWPVLTQIYFENGLYYRFDSDPAQYVYRFTVGVRLF